MNKVLWNCINRKNKGDNKFVYIIFVNVVLKYLYRGGYVDKLVSELDIWCYMDIFFLYMNNIMKLVN